MTSRTLLEWLIEAEGPFFWPQVVCAVLGIAQVLFCLLWMRPARLGIVRKRGQDSLGTPDASFWQALIDQVVGDASDFAAVLRAGARMRLAGRPVSTIDRQIEESVDDCALALEHPVRWLAAYAQISVYLGLLGTVAGLAQTFAVIGLDQAVRPAPSDLAVGVSRALATTICGLCLAIPAYWAFNLFTNRADKLVARFEQEARQRLLPEASDVSSFATSQTAEKAKAVAIGSDHDAPD